MLLGARPCIAKLEDVGWRRSVFVQLGFFFHMKLAMGAPVVALTRPLVFAMSFMLVFSIVIALFKDIPDVKGDAQVPPPPLCHPAKKRKDFCTSTELCVSTTFCTLSASFVPVTFL